MTASKQADVCLQCEQSREQVRRDQTFCGIVSGHEYRELEMEWPRHHWADWSDAELRRMRISESRWSAARRMALGDLEWEMIASICDRDGHQAPPTGTEGAEWYVPGRCVRCYEYLTQSVAEAA